ncbi:multinuclear nonheme iron-dependent oxidase [Vallitalea okinawensis]|uniref:multinuclear nonheme iron-dependent oxidase n=1 Tax=Vallitalea okinawensis TaxID=2078660 RepID=UPI000CFD4C73|nr:DUF692 family multinuclear iron-containing protein [Vallitalea okinawensis]
MKLACNYYIETEELVKAKLIDIDYFKFPSLGFQAPILDDLDLYEEFLNEKKQIKPFIIHGLYPSPHNVCSPSFKEELRTDIIQRIIDQSETPGISLHFDGAEEDASRDEIIEIAVDNLIFLKETFKEVEFIAIENVEKSRSPFLSDPEVISKVVKRADINFLLDISHAIWSSNYRKEEFFTYINKLPLDKVYEIHINGWAEKNDDLMCHIKIGDDGYKILQYLLRRCSPEIITLEYGRHNDRIGIGCPVMKPDSINEKAKEEIIEQVSKLREIIRR